jgi:phosphatidylglycerol:prolipoprotein diacylglycerol transferase
LHPEVLELGPVVVRAYGVMLALSFLLGTFYVWRMSRRFGRSFEPLIGMAYVLVIAGMVGARLGYVVVHLSEFAGNPWAAVNPFAGESVGIAGLNVYAGLLLAMVSAWIWCRVKGLDVLDTFDLFAPAFALGLGLTRIGCFLNGCCFGTPCDLPWAVTSPFGSIPYAFFGATPLHPAQLYSSVYGFVLFGLLHLLLKRRAFAGQVAAVLLMVEAGARFSIEFVRYYETTMHVPLGFWNPTYNHLVALGLFVTGAAIYLSRWRNRDQSPPEGE